MKSTVTKLTPEKILEAIEKLTPGEKESLEILCDEKFASEILQARERIRRGETIPESQIFGKSECTG